MNLHRAFQTATAIVLAATVSSSAFALEATATNHTAESLNAFDTKLQTYQAILTAALNELTHRIDVCTAADKLYGPTHPDKDADNCVTQVTSNTLPSAVLCDVGEPPVSNGSTWTCQKTFTSPQCNGQPCIWNAPTTVATGNKFCQTKGYSTMSQNTPGSGGCESCYYNKWDGAAWVLVGDDCSSCRPFQTVTCY